MSGYGQRNRAAAKLTPYDVQQIRRRYTEGETQGKLARDFSVSVGQIGRIVRNESWNSTGLVAPRVEATREELEMSAARLLRLQEQTRAERSGPPPSPLDGGDAPSESNGEGLSTLSEVAKKLGAGG